MIIFCHPNLTQPAPTIESWQVLLRGYWWERAGFVERLSVNSGI
ncbi:MAG: hypothetical protein RIE73_04205 [Coleofasciculus sp. C1-SOL-03]